MATTSKTLRKNTNSANADLAYTQRRENVEEILGRIVTSLKQHSDAQRQDSHNWGYVGDLSRVQEELAQVLAALGNNSAVSEIGLEY